MKNVLQPITINLIYKVWNIRVNVVLATSRMFKKSHKVNINNIFTRNNNFLVRYEDEILSKTPRIFYL